jgi:tetratricopeptide (TPR) repeat protein
VLRVLVIITFRPEFQPRWVGRPHVTLLSLRRLAPRQRAEMITRVTGGKALPKEIADQIIDRTDGVPLFIEELTKSVVESGLVREAGDHFAVAGPAAPLAIPTTLHASLLARLDRLAPTREVAQIGAALGRSFSYELISAVAQMPQHKLDNALEQLVDAELIFQRGISPDSEYTFKHALVQDAAYSTLLRSRRQQIHARIVTTLESQFPEVVSAQPALMAQHCGEAGLKEKAVGFWLQAGQRALARSATTEAVTQLRKGLEALTGVPDGTPRQQHELKLLSALGSALTAAKGWSAADVSETCSRARALAEQLDRAEYLVPLIMVQYAFHLVRAEHRLALPLVEQLKKLGESRNDPSVQWLGCGCEGMTRFLLGELDPARALLERFYRLSDPAHRTIEGLSFDAYAVLLTWFALALAYSGYVDQARSRMNEALSEARRLKHAHTLAHVLVFTDWLDWLVCSPIVHSTETIELAREHGFPHYLGWGLAYRGKSLIELGQAQQAFELLTEGLAELRASEGVVSTPMLLTWLAEAHAMIGQSARAQSYLAEAAQVVEATEERVSEAELLHRVPGDLLYAKGDRDAAERRYRRALDVAEQHGARLFQLRASTSLARLWRDQGKRTEARDLLTPICGWFTEGFDTAVLQEAKALLDELA